MTYRNREINSSKIFYIIGYFDGMEENDEPMGENLKCLHQYVIRYG